MLSRTVARQTALVARSTPQKLMQIRGVHIENTVYNNMPFKYQNKKALAFKTTVFFVAGLGIPIVAVGYQLSKSKGGGSGDA